MEDRAVPATLDITAGTLTYTADAGTSSNLIVSIDSGDTALVTFTDTDQAITLGVNAIAAGFTYDNVSHTEVSGPLSALTSMTVTGSTNLGQSLTVDYSSGDPLPASGLAFTPTAATSGASNSLALQGGSFLSETESPTGPAAGTITYSDATNTNVPITYSNLSGAVIDTVTSPTFIFNAPAGAATVHVANGPTVSGTQTDEINDGGTGDFTLTDFANKSAVTVNANNSGSTVGVDNSTAAAGLSALFVNSGAGNETVNVLGTSIGVATTIDTGSPAGSVINVTGADGIDGALNLQSTGGANRVNIGSTAPAAGGNLAGIDAAITVGDGITTLVIDDSGNTTAGQTATIGASGPGLVLTGLDMGSSGSVTGAGDSTSTTINAGNSVTSDTFDVDESSAITFPLSLNGGGSGVLNIAGGSFTTDTYNYTGPQAGSIHLGNSIFSVISYAGLASLNNSGTAATEIFNLPIGGTTATLANGMGALLSLSSGATTFAPTAFSNPTGSLTINAGSTADALAISGASNLTAGLTAGSSSTPFATVTLSGALTLSAGTAALAITAGSISDTDSTSVVQAGTVDLTGTGTVATAAAIINIRGAVIESTTGNILIQGSGSDNGSDGVEIQNGGQVRATSATGTVTIQGIGGSNAASNNSGVVVTGSGSEVSSAGGNISITGTGGVTAGDNDGVDVEDGGKVTATGAGAVLITGTGDITTDYGVNISGTGAAITSATGSIAITAVSGGLNVSQPVSSGGPVTLTGNGTINIAAPITGSTATVLGGSGADTITVTTTGATPLMVDGTGGGDTITVLYGALASPVAVSETGGGTNTLNFDAQSASVGTVPGGFFVGAVLQVSYSGVQALGLTNATSVNSISGPDTADRVTALTGLTADERFVQALYLDDLGRAGTQAELDTWVNVLNAPGGSQQAVANGIATSLEADAHLVTSWYITYLGRSPQGGEDQSWVGLLQAGVSEEQVLSDILSSGEFFLKAGGTNTAFVQSLYQTLLNRTGSSVEVSYWLNALASGTGRQQVVLDFLQSQEYRTDQFEGFYNALLHRPPAQSELNSWVSSNLGFRTVLIDFESGSEFFTNG